MSLRTVIQPHKATPTTKGPIQLIAPKQSFGFGSIDLFPSLQPNQPDSREDANKASFAQDWNKWSSTVAPSNQRIDARVLDGEIPDFLEGEWYRNGPGKFEVGRTKVRALDGDGLVYRVAFKGKRAWVQSKFVRTQGLIEDQRLQKSSSRGAFGTESNAGLLGKYLPIFKNPANTNIAYWGGQLFALWEGGPPYRLDHATLDTVAKGTGFLRKGEAFGAHPKIDFKRRLLVNIGTNVIANFLSPWQKDRLLVWEIDQNCRLQHKQSISLRHPFALLHDFCITDNYTVVPQSPIALHTLNLAIGGNLGTALYPTDGRLLFYVIPRHDRHPKVFTFEAERLHVLHCINAYEAADATVVIDVVAYAEMPRFAELMDSEYLEHLESQSPVRLTSVLRYELRLDNDDEEVQCTPLVMQEHQDICVEFPCINSTYQGSAYNFAYFVDITPVIVGNTTFPFSAMLKLDIRTGSLVEWKPLQEANERVFLGDPVFVPRPGSTILKPSTEDEGILIVSCFHADASSSKLALVDAKNMSTLTRLDLGMQIPVGLHTAWVNSTELQARAAEDRTRE